MAIYLKTDKNDVDWNAVSEILTEAGLSSLDANTQKKVFENSDVVSFVYDNEKLIGCARALSDGVCQAAVYNVALKEEYRGKQTGRLLINGLLDQLKGCNVILYTHPQTIALYEKFGFRRQKTGMALYSADSEHLNWMEDTGFLLPEGYRFHDNYWENLKSPVAPE